MYLRVCVLCLDAQPHTCTRTTLPRSRPKSRVNIQYIATFARVRAGSIFNIIDNICSDCCQYSTSTFAPKSSTYSEGLDAAHLHRTRNWRLLQLFHLPWHGSQAPQAAGSSTCSPDRVPRYPSARPRLPVACHATGAHKMEPPRSRPTGQMDWICPQCGNANWCGSFVAVPRSPPAVHEMNAQWEGPQASAAKVTQRRG